MQAAMRKIGALCQKDFADTFRNPSMIISVIMPIALALFYRYLLGDMGSESPDTTPEQAAAIAQMLESFLLSTSLCLTIGAVVAMTVVYGIAEEKEKKTLRTLMLANVSAGQILVSRAAVALVVSVVVATICFFVLDAENTSLLMPYLGLTVLGAIPIILLSLLLGLATRDQMTAGLYSMPVMIVAIAPIFGLQDEAVADVLMYLPTGAISELVTLMTQDTLFTSEAVLPLAIVVGWIAILAILFALLFKRLVRDN